MIKYRGTCLARVPPVRPGNPGIANEREETSLISPLISREIRRKTRLHCSLLTWTTIVLGTCPRTVSYMRNIICCRVNKENGRPLWRQFLLCRREEYDIVGPTSWIYRDSSLVIIENDNYNWQSRFEDQDIYIYYVWWIHVEDLSMRAESDSFLRSSEETKGWKLDAVKLDRLILDARRMIKRLSSPILLCFNTVSISREADKSRCDERDIDTGTRKLVQNVRVNAMWRDTG